MVTSSEVAGGRRPGPILVTGVPRSGTTWLARLLATAPGTALAGREPMNPRQGQYALAGTLRGWTRLTEPTLRQRLALRTAYRGINPLVYSRYGYRQVAGPMPWTRLVMKDPFALMSTAAVSTITGAVPVLVYRHPGAVLSSYRRMGWTPDLDELQRVITTSRHGGGPDLPDLPGRDRVSEAEAMGLFWARLHDFAVADADAVSRLVIVSHEELATGGATGGRRLFELLGLTWNRQADGELSREAAPVAAAPVVAAAGQLHNFARPSAAVAGEWRDRLDDDEIAAVEQVTEPTRTRLDELRVRLRD